MAHCWSHGAPHSRPPHSPLEAVGSREDPLGGHEGAPADVEPVVSETDLPRPLPSAGIGPAHHAGWIQGQVGGWAPAGCRGDGEREAWTDGRGVERRGERRWMDGCIWQGWLAGPGWMDRQTGVMEMEGQRGVGWMHGRTCQGRMDHRPPSYLPDPRPPLHLGKKQTESAGGRGQQWGRGSNPHPAPPSHAHVGPSCAHLWGVAWMRTGQVEKRSVRPRCGQLWGRGHLMPHLTPHEGGGAGRDMWSQKSAQMPGFLTPL